MKKLKSGAFAPVCILLLALSACGTGQDPLDLVAVEQSEISLALPYASTTSVVTITGFSPNSPNFTWTFNTNFGPDITVQSPVSGLVTHTSSTANDASVTIRVNNRYEVTVGKLKTKSDVRAGDEIDAGDTIGTAETTLNLAVQAEGDDICPYQLFNTESIDSINLIARTQLITLCDR